MKTLLVVLAVLAAASTHPSLAATAAGPISRRTAKALIRRAFHSGFEQTIAGGVHLEHGTATSRSFTLRAGSHSLIPEEHGPIYRRGTVFSGGIDMTTGHVVLPPPPITERLGWVSLF
jgi:hypothetical protein